MIRKNFKQLILAFVKPLLWAKYRSVYRAIEIVLSPCCDLVITDVVYDCGTEQLTVSISNSQAFIAGHNGFAQVFSDANGFLGAGTISSDGASVVIDIPVADTPVGVGQIFTVTVFQPTMNGNSILGAYMIGTSEAITIVAC